MVDNVRLEKVEEEFANGFFSDLAPLLALFGEQVTKQFMSQTMYWSDHLIFSMAPLGIIAAIVSATRVAGPNWMKAIIGRARESRGAAEVELMSSTSHDVCELWNGRQIVRVLGLAPVKQLLYFPGDTENCGLYTLEEAAAAHLLKEPTKDCSWFDSCLDKVKNMYRSRASCIDDLEQAEQSNDPSASFNTCAPNITLNFSDPISRKYLRLAAVLGVFLQLCVVAFAGVTRYSSVIDLTKGGSLVGRQSFILTALGTLALSLGMMLCSYAVEQSSGETMWEAKDNKEFYLIWVQKGQVVNDQLFESFALVADGSKKSLITSNPSLSACRRRNHVTQLLARSELRATSLTFSGKTEVSSIQSSSRTLREEGDLDSRLLELITVVGAFVTILGFILQFTGLRGLHWSVTVVHVTTTLLMTVVRATVRRNLAEKPTAYPLPKGFELEWLAMQLGKNRLDGNMANSTTPESSSPPPASFYRHIFGARPDHRGNIWAPVKGNLGWHIPCKPMHTENDLQPPTNLPPNLATEILTVRERLGKLTGWDGPVTKKSLILSNAMEVTMNNLHVKGDIQKGQEYQKRSVFHLKFPLDIRLDSLDKLATIHLCFEQDKREGSKWKANIAQIDALISLWLFSLSLEGSTKETDNPTNRRPGSEREERIRLLGPITERVCTDFGWWLEGSLTKLLIVERSFLSTMRWGPGFLGYGQNHPFENSQSYSVRDVNLNKGLGAFVPPEKSEFEPYLGVYTHASTSEACIQHVFSIFLMNVASVINPLGGHTTCEAKPAFSPGNYNLKLTNTTLEELVKAVSETGLCSYDEAYFAIVPPLSAKGKLPRTESVIDWARGEARLHEEIGHWNEAARIYQWLFSTCKSFGHNDKIALKATAHLVELTRSIASTIVMWEKQYRGKASLDQLKGLSGNLLEMLQQDPQFWNVSQELLQLSSMREKLQNWGSLCHSKEGVASDVQQSLPKGFDINFGYTPLHEGSLSQAGWKVQKMLKGESRKLLGNMDILGRTALHYSAANNSDVAQYLLTRGANPRTADIRDWTPLHYASWYGNVKAARVLIHGGADVNANGRDGMTPLHCASARKHSEIVELLLGSGANVEMQDNGRRTPLHWASISQADDIAQYLLKKGAYAETRDEYGRIPLHLAAMTKGEVLKILLGLSKAREIRDQDGRTALHLAAQANMANMAELLLENRADIEAKDNGGDTALHLAAIEGAKDVFELLLLNESALLDARNNDALTPTDLTFWNFKKDLVDLLIKSGQTLQAKGFFPKLLLHAAVVNGRFDPILIARSGEESGVEDNQQMETVPAKVRTLHKAALEGDKARVEQLLEDDDIELDGREEGGKSALQFAAWSGNAELVKLLLDKGAEVDSKNNYGSTALHSAAWSSHLESVEVLLAGSAGMDHVNRFGNNVLHFAAWAGALPIVKLLLDRGVSCEPKTTFGSGLLHYAASSGKQSVIKEVLREGKFNVNCTNDYNNTPLHNAAMSGDKSTVEYLLQQEADINHSNIYGTTALHYATIGGSIETVQFILDNGIDIEQADHDGNTALHFAAMKGHEDIIARLLNLGADINRADNNGNTALHHAVMHKRFNIIHILCWKGAEINKDRVGNTILDLARNTGCEEVIKLVEQVCKSG